MADRQLVLSDVLCFLVNKYVKLPVKQLKCAVMDFYSIDNIAEAKVRLLDDVKQLNSGVKLPHISRHREGDGRMAREVDDLFTLLQLLDEHKLFDCLPHYVCGDPDNIPSARLFEGDMNVLLVMLEKVQRKVEEYGSALSTITRDVSQLQSKFATLSQAKSTLDDEYPPLPSVAAKPRPASSQQSSVQPRAGNSTVNTGASADCYVSDWGTLSSTPNVHANRFSVLASTTDDEEGTGQYQQVQSRKSKRLRNRTPPQSEQSQHQQQQSLSTATNETTQQPPRRRPLILGKSMMSTNIAAARKLRKKAVFCVDNVKSTCTPDDIKYHVSCKLSVNVISVFDAKSRRRQFDSTCKAFRLCVYHDDRECVSDPANWPDSVIISDWFFKSESERENQGEQNKKIRLGDAEEAASGAAAGVDATAGTSAVESVGDPADCSTSLGDDTIIAAYNVNNMGDAISIDNGK